MMFACERCEAADAVIEARVPQNQLAPENYRHLEWPWHS